MSQENNLTNAFKAISLLYFALGAGMLFSLGVFYFVVETGTVAPNPDLASSLMIVVPILGISGFGAGKYIYGLQANKSKEVTNENEKLQYYRTASLITWATLEAPGLFACVAYFLTADQLFLAYFAMIFLVFIFSKPSITKFQQDF